MKLALTAVILSLGSLVYARTECQPRELDNYGSVCVCSVDYCDDLDPFQATSQGIITVFETTRDGDRLRQVNLNFGDNNTEPTSGSQTINIDRSRTAQTIIGFGGSFTDATGYMVTQLPEALQARFVSDYFSETGAEYNLNRVPIGGADFSTRAYSYDDGHDGDFNLDNFQLQDEDFNYKIPFMRAARDTGAQQQRFFASPWSAPAWMKNNSELNHGGYLIGNPGEQYYQTFARYFVKFLDAYRENDVEIWGITIENEPSAGNQPTYGFNSMGFNPELQRDFIKLDLGPTLEAAGYGPDQLQVMIFDDQRDVIHQWAQTIFSDPDAERYVHGTAFHWYVNNDDNLNNLEITHQVNPDKYILNTEASNGGIIGGNNWYNLEAFARDIIVDLNHWVNGWVTWNMALDLQGGPNWAGLAADAPVLVNPDAGEYYKQPCFYGLAHFSKFILPGSVRIDHDQSSDNNNLLTTVFQRPDGGVVVTALNTGDDSIQYTISDSGNQLVNVIHGHTLQTYVYYP